MKKIDHAFGDSITAGSLSSTYSKSYIGLMVPLNSGQSNDMSADLSNKIHGTNYPNPNNPVIPDGNKTYSIMIGTNDQNVYKNDSTKQGYYKKFLRASIAWLAIANKVTGVSVSMTKTGNWSNSLTNNFGIQTRLKDSTAEAIVNGNSVYIGFILQNYANTSSSAEIRIDGVLVDTLTAAAITPSMNTTNGSTYSCAAVRYTDLGEGSHTVNVKITSSNNDFYLNYIAGSDQLIKPKVLVSNILKMSSAMYTAAGINLSTTQTYNSIIEEVINEFISDGLNVSYVDNYSSIDPSIHLVDGIHPGDAGHQIIYNNFLNSL